MLKPILIWEFVFNFKEKLNEAIKLHNIAISLKPDYAEPHYNLSLSLLSTGLD